MANRKIASWPNKQILNWKIAQGEWTASVFQAWQTQTENPSEGLEINQANCSQIGAVIIFHEPIQAYLVLLYITLSLFADNNFLFLFFYKLRVSGSPVLSKSISTIFLTAFAYFVFLCHILVILIIFQTCHQQKDSDSRKVQMTASIFSNKVFWIRVYILLFRYNTFVYIVDHSILSNFYIYWETESSCYLLYCNIYFIVVIRNWNHSVSKVCPYSVIIIFLTFYFLLGYSQLTMLW